MATLKSLSTRDPNMDYSTLTLVWFQDQFAFPLCPDMKREIQDPDWHAFAVDHEY